MRLPIFTTLCAAALVAGCTVNPYTGERQASRAATYGGGAAVACALVGSIESSKWARNAALGCGLAGAGVGAYMDVQEAKLRQQLEGTGVRVSREGDNIRLIMPGNITFATNEFAIRPEFYSVLDSVAQVLYKYKDTRLIVNGHTDSTGSADYNYNLSTRRATSVSNYLASRGVDQSRLIAQGMGPSQPIASNDTEAGRAQNRRVELQIVAVPNS